MRSSALARRSAISSAPRWFGLTLVVACLQTTAFSQSSDQRDRETWLENRFPFRVSARRDSGPMMELVKPLCAVAGESSVQIFSGDRPVALGLVVHQDGLIVTKRSELSGDPIRVRLSDKRLVSARVAAVRREDDLALLECDAKGLKASEFYATEDPQVGSFLVTVGRGGRPIHLGVVSVASRPLPATGRLGVRLEDDRQGTARVGLVFPGSGAEAAGLQPGDKIMEVDGRPSAGSLEVTKLLKAMFPGESVRLTIARDGDTVELEAQIREFNLMLESADDARLNGPRNKRLTGFDLVLQHDTVLDPDQCGGPVVDSKGRIVGLNIARAGRVMSYALPASLVKPLVDSMIAEVLVK
ncbi:PDZ domain-containing protein [Planctomycetaceae bacterium SH139]